MNQIRRCVGARAYLFGCGVGVVVLCVCAAAVGALCAGVLCYFVRCVCEHDTLGMMSGSICLVYSASSVLTECVGQESTKTYYLSGFCYGELYSCEEKFWFG